jgi:hypothetical protein
VPVPRLDDDFAIPNVCETTPTTHAPAYREWFVVQIDFTRADLEINWDAFAPLRDNTLGLELDWPTWTAPEIERPDSALSIRSDQAVHNRFGLVMVGKELPTIPEESEY